jgi:peptidoglycan-associated lipoprotein
MNARRFLLLVAPVAALALAGCASKPKDGECKTSADCEAQEGYGKICVEGRCQECGTDTDCKAGFMCQALKCVPVPPPPPPPPPPPVSRAECVGDADCGSGKACQAGTCVVAQPVDCPAGGGKLAPVYFGFNEAVLTREAQAQLAKDATCIKDRGFKRIVVEGNCDERGTVEYNLHLGQRRAEAVKKYLVNIGVPAKAIKTVSFGKEKPVCLEQTEECWARCRRGDTVAQ